MAVQHPKDFVRERIIYGYNITLPHCPPKEKIDGYNLPQKDQRFKRNPLPEDLRLWTSEKRKEYIANEWDKRLNGYWFYNNGNIEYISGLNYFYLAWWKIGNQYPMWTDMNRDFFYIWNMCENDIYCDGLVFVSYRGSGKTLMSTAILYEPISRKYGVNGGIQSKTDSDAKKIFKRLVSSWQRLPTFFKPLDIGENRPTSILDFSEPSKKDTKQLNKEAQDFLGSTIGFASSAASAYDGDNLHRVVIDEFAKAFLVDTVERLKVVRETLRAGRSQYGRGKILNTSTVEESEKKGTINSRKIWEESNPAKRDANGFTANGMYRIFVPATDGYLEIIGGESFIDDYGYSLKEKAKQFFLNKRATLKGNDLNSEKRKYPLEEKDIWVSNSKKSTYDTSKIDEQIKYNDSIPDNLLVKGNFLWKGGIRDTEVFWHPCENGKWLIYWMPQIQDRNKKVIKYGLKSPANIEMGCFGLDPYDNKTTVDDRKSDAASYGFRKFDPMIPYDSGIFVCEYVNRPEKPEIMWEDMILQSVFYGWQILIETNKIGTTNYFRMRGYYNYLMMRPEETQTVNSKIDEPGIPMSGLEPRQALVDVTESYIINKVGLIQEEGVEAYMGKCYFNKLLHNWKDFDVDSKWTEFDSMVGAGLALLGARKYIPKKKNSAPIVLFERYDTSGVSSKLIGSGGLGKRNKRPTRDELEKM